MWIILSDIIGLFSKKTITQSLGFSGNVKLTDKWKIGFRSGYDFIQKSLTHTH